jgi:hypothetical protein
MSDNDYTPTDDDMANAIGDWALRAGHPDSENRPELLTDDGETMLARWIAARDTLESVTVPTENEREALYKVFRDWSNRPTSLETITKSNDETLADAILAAGLRFPVPVEPEYEYRRRAPFGVQPKAVFDSMPALNDGEWAQRRFVGEWENSK